MGRPTTASVTVAALLLLLLLALAAASESRVPVRVRLSAGSDASRLLRESPDSVDVDHVYPARGYATAHVTREGAERLRTMGFSLETLPEVPRTLERRSSQAANASNVSWAAYHGQAEVEGLFAELARDFPGICRTFEVGRSGGGARILGLEISDNVSGPRDPLEPAVRLVGNVHGDEVVGRELILRLAHHLVTQYGNRSKHPEVAALVDGAHVFLIPSLNPDGFSSGSRYNSRNVDLNRDFPDQFVDKVESTENRQPETVAIMSWSMAETTPQFVLGAAMHGGAVVANYPYDGNSQQRSGLYTASPDDAVFRMLAKLYSDKHPTMHKSVEFAGGITNGAEWYVLYRGMQDWDYVYRGTLDVTLELSDDKWPPATRLPLEWEMNYPAMMAYLSVPLWCGVRASVVDATTGKPVTPVFIKVKQIPKDLPCDRISGACFRLLTPGEYDVMVYTPAGSPYLNSSFTHVHIPLNQTDIVNLTFTVRKQGEASALVSATSTVALRMVPLLCSFAFLVSQLQ